MGQFKEEPNVFLIKLRTLLIVWTCDQQTRNWNSRYLMSMLRLYSLNNKRIKPPFFRLILYILEIV